MEAQVSRNIKGEINCSECGVDVSTRHWTCDEDLGGELDDSREFCEECFQKHPCGQGQHDEQCATLVTLYEPHLEDSKNGTLPG